MLIGATAAHGQDDLASQPAAESDEAIIVTGSRLRLTGMDTPVPVTSVEAVELKQMAPNTLVEGLSQLPQFYGNGTPSGNNFFGSGSSGSLNLRGLGANRTLVLLNGRRMISGSAFGGVDISTFPEALISNIETVTGGASAAYGTDAVAGVTNFRLNTSFTGFKATAQLGQTTRGDGANFLVSLTGGIKLGDRGHLIVSAERFEQQGIHSYAGRDWYQAWGPIPDANGITSFYPNVVSRNASFDGVIFAPGTAINGLAFDRNGATAPFVTSSLSTGTLGTPPARHSITNGGSGDDLGGGDDFTLQPDFERSSIFAYADYEVANGLTLFAQYIHGRKSTSSFNTPRGSFGGTPTALTIFQDNAFLPDSLRQTMVDNNIASFTLRRMGHSSDLGANYKIADENVMNSGTVGFSWQVGNGGFMSDWSVDGYYQYGQSTRTAYQTGLRVDRVFAAIDAVRDPATGQIVCRTTLFNSTFSGCQPLNLFGRGNASAQAVDWVIGYEPGQTISTPIFFADSGYALGATDSYVTQEAKVTKIDLKQHVAELSFAGNLHEGWGAGPIALAFGGGYRKEQILQIARDPTNPPADHTSGHPVLCNGDPAAIAAGLRGVNGPDCANTVGMQYSKVSNINGQITVKEAFAEVLVPILSNTPFFDQLSVNLAARWADYSGSGGIWAYKGGVDWSISKAFRLRGTYSRDVRAANLSERFDKTGGSATLTDPRYPGDGIVTITRFSGGNPNVRPELADTYTAGAVFEPGFIDGLSISVDWYQINMKDSIGQLGTQAVVNNCEAGATDLCSLVTRDTATDRLILVGDVFVNVDKARVEGVDLEVSYRHSLALLGGDESISMRGFASWLMENSQRLGSVSSDRAGQTGIQQSDGLAYSLPNFKLTANTTYRNGGVSAFLQGRYIAPGTYDNLPTEAAKLASNRIAGAFYADLRLGYTVEMDSGRTVEFFGTITNLFDKSPPISPYYSAFLGYTVQTNGALFDTIGRRFVVGAKVSL